MNIKNYLFIDPFKETNSGVCTYIQSASKVISNICNVDILKNNTGKNTFDFQKDVFNYVNNNYGINDVIIEAPETRYSALLLNKSYNVHTRLHTPLGLCHRVENKQIDEKFFSCELRVISQAKFVSSPSHGLVKALKNDIDLSNARVFKNPIEDIYHDNFDCEIRDIDVLYLGRFQRLKGTDFLPGIFAQINTKISIHIIGGQANDLNIDLFNPIHFHGFVTGSERFNILKRAKCVIVPSIFENCSMVILEALRAGCKVVAWDVGGNSEFPADMVKTIQFGNIRVFAQAIEKSLQEGVTSFAQAKKFVHDTNEKFCNSIKSIVDCKNNTKNFPKDNFYHNDKFKPEPLSTKGLSIPNNDLETFFSKKKIFGFSISNEHLEEMWAPIINYLGTDYRFVCKRPLGFHKKFDKNYYIDPNKFTLYDWVNAPERLLSNINKYNPDIILFHNGAHNSYQTTLDYIKRNIDIPIIYSELGWLPQYGNIYFDRLGVNGKSSIADMSIEYMNNLNAKDVDFSYNENTTIKKDILIVLQLDNDTNLINNSPRFKSAEKFVEYILSNVDKYEDRNIYIKPHPLDLDTQRFLKFTTDKISIVEKIKPLKDIFPNVGHVLSLNSTASVEALFYPINLYLGGESIFNNKNIAIDILNNDFKLNDIFHGSIENRKIFLSYLKNRQINVVNYSHKPPLSEVGSLEYSLNPIIEAFLKSKTLRTSSPITHISPPITIKQNKGKYIADETDIKKISIDSNNVILNKKTIYFKNFMRPLIVKCVSEKKLKKFDANAFDFFFDSQSKLSKLLAVCLEKPN